MNNLCSILGTVLLALVGMAVLATSFEAVSHVSTAWTWLDYWLGWFAFFSFVIGFICFCVGIAATAIQFGEICNRPPRS